ncbi:MAG: 30S ribosomal protein S6 [Deltaproteobacteria bacterium]|nr:30S ribosomal protein S6 [Deltaproteobacteria bacterium]
MREYETVYIIHPELAAQQVSDFNERLGTTIAKNGGRLFVARDMGKRSLAYPIQKQTKGTYTCLDYAGDGTVVSEIERLLRFDEQVLRFLTVVKNEKVDVEARAQEVIARGEDKPLTASVEPVVAVSDTHEKEAV